MIIYLFRYYVRKAFKTNDYLCRALLTGITRVSTPKASPGKESIFSDLNNLNIATTTTEKYCTAFGFTEKEVADALESKGLLSEMEHIRFWYDGFIFGSKADIYNPWSITMYLDLREYSTYWEDTSLCQS